MRSLSQSSGTSIRVELRINLLQIKKNDLEKQNSPNEEKIEVLVTKEMIMSEIAIGSETSLA